MPARSRANRPMVPSNVPIIGKSSITSKSNTNPGSGEQLMHRDWYRWLTTLNDSMQDPGFSWCQSCLLATPVDYDGGTGTGDIGGVYDNGNQGVGATLYFSSGLPVIDNFTIDSTHIGKRILVKEGAGGVGTIANGIYVIQPDLKTLTRAQDFDGSDLGQIRVGSCTFITNGNQNRYTVWTQTPFDSAESGYKIGYASMGFVNNILPPTLHGVGDPNSVLTNNYGNNIGSLYLEYITQVLYISRGLDGWIPVNAAPIGAAGGDLSGTYPNPTVSRIEGVDVSVTNATAVSNLTGVNSGDQSVFTTIAVSGQSNIVADSVSDTLTVVAGSGITLTTDASTDTLTITNDNPTAYTDEQAQDAVGNILTDTATIDFTYTDGGPTITADVKNSSIDLTTKVTGVLPIANGGTAVTALPSFSVNRNTNQSITSTAAYTKINWTVENFDTNSNFDITTNDRFTPTIAGKYQINCTAMITNASAAGKLFAVAIYLNGAISKQSIFTSGSAGYVGLSIGHVISFNGSTDYVEFYFYNGDTGTVTLDGATYETSATGHWAGN